MHIPRQIRCMSHQMRATAVCEMCCGSAFSQRGIGHCLHASSSVKQRRDSIAGQQRRCARSPIDHLMMGKAGRRKRLKMERPPTAADSRSRRIRSRIKNAPKVHGISNRWRRSIHEGGDSPAANGHGALASGGAAATGPACLLTHTDL